MNENQETKYGDLNVIMAGWDLMKELKEKYPDVDFSIHTDKNEICECIYVNWNGNPKVEEVDKIAEPHKRFFKTTTKGNRFVIYERCESNKPRDSSETYQTKLGSE